MSRMSLSNTLKPCRTWSRADCSRSRLYCSASDASSSRRRADWLPASPRRSSSDRTRRAEAAPMALASRCSVKRSRWMSASASGEMRRIAAFGVLGERALGALGSQIAGNRVLQVAGGDGRAPEPERRRHGRARQVVEHEDLRLQALDRLGRLQQRHDHEHQDVDGYAPQHAVRQRLESAGRTGPCGDRKLRPNGPSVRTERDTQPASMIQGSSSV